MVPDTMRKLQMPGDEPAEVFNTCISRVRSADLKERLASVEPDIVTAANEFQEAASIAMLHTLHIQEDVNGIVSGNEMSDVYTNRMAKKGSPGRSVYEKLLAAPAYGRCPLCGQRTVSTLDHHMPKVHYPALTVVPVNLVPSCADCNKAKTTTIPNSQEEQTLHPYFDDVEDELWLHAKVLKNYPATLLFYVDVPDSWGSIMSARVRYHFKIFKLAALYASHAAGELVNISYRLARLFDKAGAEAVRDHLQEEAESREAVHTNSWQTAMYKALAASEWYCSGGFNV